MDPAGQLITENFKDIARLVESFVGHIYCGERCGLIFQAIANRGNAESDIEEFAQVCCVSCRNLTGTEYRVENVWSVLTYCNNILVENHNTAGP